MQSVIVDGQDLGEFGFIPADDSLPEFGSSHSIEATQGSPGGVRIGGVTPAGELAVDGKILAPTRTAAVSALDDLIVACRVGSEYPSVIRLPHYPDREWLGFLDRSTRQQVGRWTTRAFRLTLKWALADPRARARVASSAPLPSGVPVVIALGNAVTEPVITVTDPAGDVAVEVLNAGGEVIRRLDWTHSGDGDLVIDSADRTITHGGTNDPELDYTSVFPILDPLEAPHSIRLIGGSGTLTYYKRWW